MSMHDLLCQKKCKCGECCYADPYMELKFHRCYNHLLKDGLLIELSFIESLKNLGSLIIFIPVYFMVRAFKCTSR